MKYKDFVISTISHEELYKADKIYYKNASYIDKSKNRILFLKGEIFEPYINIRELYEIISKKGIEVVKELKGEFALAYYDGKNTIYCATDKIAPIKLYYYYNTNIFIVSTDFWEIVKIIKPAEDDIDIKAVKELIILHRPLFGRTIIKHLYILDAANILSYDIKSNNLSLTKYWELKFKKIVRTVDEAANRLDKAIDLNVKRIIELNKDKIFGVGISGGLDSRIIPYYLFKHGTKKIIGFIIGEKRPNKLFLSRDHKNARSIAKYYNIPLYEINYDSEDIRLKALLDIRYNPIYTSNILKATFFDHFDVLVTGSYGAIVGGHILTNDIYHLNSEQLALYILEKLSLIYKRSMPPNLIIAIKNKIGRLLRISSSSQIEDKYKNQFIEIPGLISDKEVEEIYNKLLDFVRMEKSKDKSNVEIFMEYHLSLSNKAGAFESLNYRKASYSIYYPYVLEEIVNWDPNLLIGRKTLEKLIIMKIPYLAKIPGQNLDPPIIYKYNQSNRKRLIKALIKRYYKIIGLLRGRGLYYAKWRYNKKFLNFANEVFAKPNPLFQRHFDVEKIIRNSSIHPFIVENLVKIKYMLDIILYKRFNELEEIEHVVKRQA